MSCHSIPKAPQTALDKAEAASNPNRTKVKMTRATAATPDCLLVIPKVMKGAEWTRWCRYGQGGVG